MSLSPIGCDGGTVLAWTKVNNGRFHHYATLRSASSSMSGAVQVPGSYSEDRHALSAADTSAAPGSTWFYRTFSFDADDEVIAFSSVQSADAKPIRALGAMSAQPAGQGKTKFGWSPYGGPAECFTHYKLVHSQTDPAPSYLDGDPAWAAIGEQGSGQVTLVGPVKGETYFVRLEAIRTTALGSFVVAHTDVLGYTAP